MRNTIKVERAKRDMTQAALAALAGVSRQTINAIETADYNPSVMLALKIARIFDLGVNDIFCLEEGD